MNVRGPKPKAKVHIEWSDNFAYAIGLLASDGHMSKDGRHIDLTSKDVEQLENFMICLGISNKIGSKRSGAGLIHKRVQFGDVHFYQFLLSIGMTPTKSKTIGSLDIPRKYFFDFLRGSFDGDGSFHSYFDPRWKSSFMFYTTFASASRTHVDWIRAIIEESLGVTGHITTDGRKRTHQLKYAKADSLKILKSMYYSDTVVCLDRKRQKIKKALRVANKTLNS